MIYNPFNRKRRFSTILNLIGMSLSIAAFIAILIQVRYDWGYDTQHPGSDRILRFEYNYGDGTNRFTTGICRPFIEAIKGTMSGVEAVGTFRIVNLSKTDIYKTDNYDQKYELPCAQTDSDMIRVLGLTLAEGRLEDFGANSVIISESAARTLFDGEPALGKTLRTSPDGPDLRIAGVYPTPPQNCSVPDGIIANLGDESITDGSAWSYMCFLRIGADADRETVLATFKEMFFKAMGGEESDRETFEQFAEGIRLTPIHECYYMTDVQGDPMAKGNRTTTNTLFAVSLLIIVIALINFVNFATASVPFRIRSINTLRVLGSSRAALVMRSLADSVLIAVMSFAISVLLLHLLSGSFLAGHISGSLAVADNIGTLAIGLAVTVACAVVAGLYPAIYSTSFQPAMVLKGSFSLSAEGRALRNILVGVQYVASFTLAAFALFIFVQTRYMKSFDMGFRTDQVLTVYMGNTVAANGSGFEQRLLQNPNITDVTFTGANVVSRNKMGWGRDFNGNRVQIDIIPCSTDFVKFFGMEIVEGRDFVETDNQNICGTFILNETAMQTFPFLGVGAKLSGHMGDDQPAEIVGVVKDFNFKPMQYGISPLALYVFGSEPWWPLAICYVKVSPQDIGGSIEYIRKTLKEFDPNISESNLDIRFLDDINGRYYAKEESLNSLITFASGLSFVIALIGILGLVYFETQFKRKETAIRKVYGASVRDILRSMNMRYLALAGVSFVVSVPLSLYILSSWAENFTYKAPVPVWIFVVALLAGVVVTVVTVTLRSLQAAHANPVESIKNE